MPSHPHAIPVAGSHALGAVLEECPEVLLEIWTGRDCRHPLLDQAAEMGIAVNRVKSQTMATIDPAHRGLLGWCRPPVLHRPDWLYRQVHQGLVVMLDRVTDAHNFGACVRSIEAAGAAALLIPERNTAGFSAGAAKSSSGALFRVPVVSCASLAKEVDSLVRHGWDCAALSEQSDLSLYQMAPTAKQLVVLGNEQQGVSQQIVARCQRRVCIPTRGRNASLNVAVATGIAVLWIASLMPGDSG